MFNVLDMHNKYTVRIFIVSLYKITKIINYKIAHQPPPPHLLLELMSPKIVRQLLCRHIKLVFVHNTSFDAVSSTYFTARSPKVSTCKNDTDGQQTVLGVFFGRKGGGGGGKLGLDPGRPLKNRSNLA